MVSRDRTGTLQKRVGSHRRHSKNPLGCPRINDRPAVHPPGRVVRPDLPLGDRLRGLEEPMAQLRAELEALQQELLPNFP
jgi:hypothetical protein